MGLQGHEWYALGEQTYALYMLGRWDEALARLGEIPDEQLGRTTQIMSVLTGVVELCLHRGDTARARQLLTRYEAMGQSSDLQSAGSYAGAAAAVALADGDPAAALVHAERAIEAGRAFGIAAQDVKQGFLHALEALLALGNTARAEELLTLVEEQPIGLRPPFLDALCRRFRGRLARSDPSADADFVAAAQGMRRLELPFHLAVVLLEHGEWLAERGRPDDAEPLLAEARETFARLGATPWLERAGKPLASGLEAEPVGA